MFVTPLAFPAQTLNRNFQIGFKSERKRRTRNFRYDTPFKTNQINENYEREASIFLIFNSQFLIFNFQFLISNFSPVHQLHSDNGQSSKATAIYRRHFPQNDRHRDYQGRNDWHCAAKS